ncbi:hypothetical protein NKH85_28180 [Mesorhizobium sp. M0924]|uniref:hypothetical protein n=1 Tax=unclassified Mesorhizobium TaxID=325217 RepID=UPI0033388A43
MILSWRDVGAGLACAKIAPPEIKIAFGMARMLNIEGEKKLVFQLQTSAKKTRLCSATETHVTVYEYIAPEELLVIPPGESPLAANAPKVGAKLGIAEEPEITAVIELAEQYHAPAAVDPLLRKAGFDPTDAIVSANSVVQKEEGAIVNWVVLASGQVFLFQSLRNGGVLLRGKDDESLAEAAMAELNAHFDRSAAAG